MNTSQSQQRLDLSEAAMELQRRINQLESDRKILLRAFEAIDTENANILEDNGSLAQEARKIMRSLSRNF